MLCRPSVTYTSGSATARFPATRGTKLTMMLLQEILEGQVVRDYESCQVSKSRVVKKVAFSLFEKKIC